MCPLSFLVPPPRSSGGATGAIVLPLWTPCSRPHCHHGLCHPLAGTSIQPLSQCPHTVTSPVTKDTNFSNQTPFVPAIRCSSPPLPTLRALPRASPCYPQSCPIPPCCPSALSLSPARLGRPLMLLLCCVSVWVLGCWVVVGCGVGTVGGDHVEGRGRFRVGVML